MKRSKVTQWMCLVAVLSTLSVILYLFVKFPLPFFPPFLEINFSMLPAFLGGYMTGPIGGSVIVLIRFLCKLAMTHTAGVGEIADLVIGLMTVITASLIYKKMRTRKGAIVSLSVSSVMWVGVALFANWLFLVPSYIQLYFNGNLDAFVSLLKIIPNTTVENYMGQYLLFAVIPFNALIAIVVSTVTFFVYKPLHTLIVKKIWK